ncbi:MAG: ABC transporter substrate-binding protein [Arthrobacter sp.]|nr:ABC transporter substrate-binding protein [Arthrobacter sp.]
MKRHHLLATAALVALAGSLTACGGSGDSGNADSGSVDAKTATSVSAFGSMDQLVEAAKKEGELNVVALPDDWANYGAIKKGFEDKYGITVNSDIPDASSADEIKAAKDQAGTDTAPDVFDLGAAVALANTDMFAPYKVSTWDDIPEANKESTGLWVNDYTGIMSVGYDSEKVPEPKALDDLLGADYKGKVAINGDPTQAGAAFAAIGNISVANGGSVSDFGPGIDFMQKLKDAGNFLTVDPTPGTIASGETPVVFDWSYNNVAAAKDKPSFKTTVLPGKAYVSFYNQAINKEGPNPAAARLWQEYIFSDEGQKLFLEGNAVPVRADALKKAGAVTEADLNAVTFGTTSADWVSPTTEEVDTANALLKERWSALTK